MSNFINKLNNLFINRNLSDYPELFDKGDHDNLNFRLVSASYSVFYDARVHDDTIDWRQI